MGMGTLIEFWSLGLGKPLLICAKHQISSSETLTNLKTPISMAKITFCLSLSPWKIFHLGKKTNKIRWLLNKYILELWPCKVICFFYGGTFLYRRVNGVFTATIRWYYCCDIKWFLLFQYLRSYLPFSPSFSILCFCYFKCDTLFSDAILKPTCNMNFSSK